MRSWHRHWKVLPLGIPLVAGLITLAVYQPFIIPIGGLFLYLLWALNLFFDYIGA